MKCSTGLKLSLIVAALLCLQTSSLASAQGNNVSSTTTNYTIGNVSINQETYDIGLDAYLYLYPLVTMDITRRQMTNFREVRVFGGPMNSFVNAPGFPPVDYKGVVRPNFDTLYSEAWLNLTDGPVIISVPDTGGKYYLLPMLDMWTDVFASPGKRTTGTAAGNFAIVPLCWNGTLPEGVTRINSPSAPYVWILGRTQTNGTSDYEAVHNIQAGYKITPLSQWGKEPQPVKGTVDPSVDMITPPLRQVNSMPASTFFKYAAEIMKANPPHITDQPIIARMKRIGIEPGRSFDFNKLDPAVQQALEKAAVDGLKEMMEKSPTMGKIVNGWQVNTDTMGVYGDYYLKRAIIAMKVLGANLPEDAIYPVLLMDADGNSTDGNNTYLLHFNASELPPVDAFWSVTMYDTEGFPVANSINRYDLGGHDNLTYNKDGSLDIYIQHDNPGLDEESNWLPAPREPFSLTMRLYSPRREALDGTWSPPPVKKVK